MLLKTTLQDLEQESTEKANSNRLYYEREKEQLRAQITELVKEKQYLVSTYREEIHDFKQKMEFKETGLQDQIAKLEEEIQKGKKEIQILNEKLQQQEQNPNRNTNATIERLQLEKLGLLEKLKGMFERSVSRRCEVVTLPCYGMAVSQALMWNHKQKYQGHSIVDVELLSRS